MSFHTVLHLPCFMCTRSLSSWTTHIMGVCVISGQHFSLHNHCQDVGESLCKHTINTSCEKSNSLLANVWHEMTPAAYQKNANITHTIHMYILSCMNGALLKTGYTNIHIIYAYILCYTHYTLYVILTLLAVHLFGNAAASFSMASLATSTASRWLSLPSSSSPPLSANSPCNMKWFIGNWAQQRHLIVMQTGWILANLGDYNR